MKERSTRIGRIAAFALVILTATTLQTRACGFEDPNGVRMQKSVLTQVYPNAIYVQGAADQALRTGTLSSKHFSRPGGLAFLRTVSNLRRFANGLAEGAIFRPPQFPLVLMGPVLWTQFSPGAGQFVTQRMLDPQVDGQPDRLKTPLQGEADLIQRRSNR